MDKILSIVSLFSVIWSNALIYVIVDNEYFTGYPGSIESRRMLTVWFLIYILIFIYNIFSVRYCSKVQKEKQSSKIPQMIATVGITLYICITMIITFLVSIVEISGGA